MPSIMKSLAALAVLFTVAVEGLPAPSYVLHERRQEPSRAWIKRDRVAADAVLPMKIGLKQENLDEGYEYLMDV